MGVRQFGNSIRTIVANRHVDRRQALLHHLGWQVRKWVGAFPFEQNISSSRIIATNGRCGVSALINSQGLYNYNNMNLLKMLTARDGSIFFDVGANIGAFTLVASEQRQCRVFAFEPHPKTFRRLQDNVALNGRDNVTLVNAALSNHDGTAVLSDNVESSTNHLVGDAQSGITIRSLRGDDFCRTSSVRPTVIKIDVEGFELEVLEGFGAVLEHVGVVFVEVNGLSAARGGSEAIRHILVSRGLAGPYECDFDSKRLLPWNGATAEDPLYVSRHSDGALSSWVASAAG